MNWLDGQYIMGLFDGYIAEVNLVFRVSLATSLAHWALDEQQEILVDEVVKVLVEM